MLNSPNPDAWRAGQAVTSHGGSASRRSAPLLLAGLILIATGCSAFAREPVAEAEPTAVPATPVAAADARATEPAAGSEVEITVDTEAMADFRCHSMGTTIMGNCSEEDIARLSAKIRAEHAAASPTPALRAAETDSFRPNEDLEDVPAFAKSAQLLDLAEGEEVRLDARPVRWPVGDQVVSGYGYGGQVPGPLFRVRQGATVFVDFSNNIDQPTTVHWHGLRHHNGSDGVPGVTQSVVAPGERFRYELAFPDPGLYWYHPHVREDIQQDAGLAGAMLVVPRDPDYYLPADAEEVLILDDLLLEGGDGVPYGRESANFAIMGRFGDTLLVNGQTDYSLSVRQGDVVRFHLLNVANVRPFRVSFDGARMRLVGSDLGRYEREDFVANVTIAPAERYTVDVLFDESRAYRVLHSTPDRLYELGVVDVTSSRTARDRGATRGLAALVFGRERRNRDESAAMDALGDYLDGEPDIELVLDVEIPDLRLADTGGNAAAEEEEEHPSFDPALPGSGIEWEDEMLAVNRASDAGDVQWMIRDAASGAMNHDLAYTFRVGDRVKLRLVNDAESDHPMQHPIHFHGQRLLVLAVNGRPTTNRVWKDTVLVPAGATVDVLMDVTNTGAWMVHCHIAEHLENGMMFQFVVTGGDSTPGAP